MSMPTIDDVGGRKFLMCLLALFTTAGLCWFGHIYEGVYSAVVIAIITVYVGGNVLQKINIKPNDVSIESNVGKN